MLSSIVLQPYLESQEIKWVIFTANFKELCINTRDRDRDRDRLTERTHIWKGGDIKNLILPILLTALATLTTLQVLNAQCNAMFGPNMFYGLLRVVCFAAFVCLCVFPACCLSLLCVFFLNCYSTFAFSSSASVWDIVAPLSLRLDTLDTLATTREDLSWKRLVTFIRIFIHSIFRTVKNDQTNIYECERRLHFFTAPNTSWV